MNQNQTKQSNIYQYIEEKEIENDRVPLPLCDT